MMDHAAFIRAHTILKPVALTPEIQLYQARNAISLWQETEAAAATSGLPPPYWAFAWAGGQALARYLLDHPAMVQGRRVLDLGAGGGLAGIAAAKSGAASVLAADIDSFACAATGLNAAANRCTITITDQDVVAGSGAWDVILVGDLFYERPLAERLLAWLTHQNAAVLLGDPGRSYFPRTGVEKLASYRVPTTRELEDREIRDTGVFMLRRDQGRSAIRTSGIA